jgi:hypothetical protein
MGEFQRAGEILRTAPSTTSTAVSCSNDAGGRMLV